MRRLIFHISWAVIFWICSIHNITRLIELNIEAVEPILVAGSQVLFARRKRLWVLTYIFVRYERTFKRLFAFANAFALSEHTMAVSQ